MRNLVKTFLPPVGERFIFFESLFNETYSSANKTEFDPELAFRYSGNPNIASYASNYFNTYGLSKYLQDDEII